MPATTTTTILTLADQIERAEALALEVIARTEFERAAYRDLLLSDPFARPTHDRLHRQALRSRDSAMSALDDAAADLAERGIAYFAGNLQESTLERCRGVHDLAAATIVSEQAPHLPARTDDNYHVHATTYSCDEAGTM